MRTKQKRIDRFVFWSSHGYALEFRVYILTHWSHHAREQTKTHTHKYTWGLFHTVLFLFQHHHVMFYMRVKNIYIYTEFLFCILVHICTTCRYYTYIYWFIWWDLFSCCAHFQAQPPHNETLNFILMIKHMCLSQLKVQARRHKTVRIFSLFK